MIFLGIKDLFWGDFLLLINFRKYFSVIAFKSGFGLILDIQIFQDI